MNSHQPRWVRRQWFLILFSSSKCYFHPFLFSQPFIMARILFIPSTSTILFREGPTVLKDLQHHIAFTSIFNLYHSFSLLLFIICLNRLILREYMLSGKQVSKLCGSKCIQSTPCTYREKPCKRRSLRAVTTSWNSWMKLQGNEIFPSRSSQRKKKRNKIFAWLMTILINLNMNGQILWLRGCESQECVKVGGRYCC